MTLIRIIAFIAAALSCSTLAAADAPYNNGLIGVQVDGGGDGGREKMFVDIAKTLRPWTGIANAPVTVDANGWPTSDAATCLFDIRPVMAWRPPIDDPAQFQPDWSGIYHASLTGQAQISAQGAPAITIVDPHYGAVTNTTYFDIDVPKGQGLLVLEFRNTKRTADSPTGSGFTHLKVMRPGYPLDTKQIFTTEFLDSLAPFSTLRTMGLEDTNRQPGYYGDPGHHALNWADRKLPTDATQEATGGKAGLAWEYIVDLANLTGKDLWINIPIAATDDYVRDLATMLKQELKPNIKIYVENSNEVWNFGFPQYIYNKLAAIDEVKHGGATLNNDGATDQEVWAHRRHAKRLVEISNIFRSVFGDSAMMTRIRPVYASWTIFPQDFYAKPLAWVASTYGPPSRYFYAVACGHYFSPGDKLKTGSKDEILTAMRTGSDNSVKYYRDIIAIAKSYGLQAFVYEGGSDTGGGDPANVANRILAERDPAMKGLIEHDVRDNWWTLGGGLYMYFSQAGAYSRYGCWGATEDVANMHTYKLDAIRELAGEDSNTLRAASR